MERLMPLLVYFKKGACYRMHIEKYSSKSNIIPGGQSTANNRIMMQTTADEQAVVLCDPDYNNLSSSYIKDIMRCTTDIIAEADFTVIKLIEKGGTGIFTQFLLDEKNKVLQVIQSKIYETTSEQHLGYEVKSLKRNVGEKIVTGEKLIYATSYTEKGLAQHGRNLTAMTVTSRATTEDPIKLSVSAAAEFDSPEYEKITIQVDERNMLLKNIYGDNDNYRPLPDIGEHIHDGILCVIKKNAKFITSNDSLKRISLSDTVFRRNGSIMDIVVRSPIRRDHSGNIEQLHNTYLNDKRNQLISYELELLNYMNGIRFDYPDCKTTKEFRKLHSKLKAVYEDDYSYSVGGININNIIVEVHIKHISQLEIGQKLTG
jgi:hypothetical protein